MMVPKARHREIIRLFADFADVVALRETIGKLLVAG